VKLTRTTAAAGLVAFLGTFAASFPPPALAADACAGWTMRTIFSGLGVVEYLLPDGAGGLLISSGSRNDIERLGRDGSQSVYLAGINAPGAMVRRGGQLYITTGDAAASGATNTADGTVLRVDLATKAVTTYSSGLVMPNGMTFSAAGDAYITRDIGTSSQVVKVPHADPGHPQTMWANQGDTNGARVDPSQTWLYVSTTFNQPADVYRIRLSDPGTIQTVASLASVGNALPKGLDDMTADAAGNLYIAANGSGELLRLDPVSGAACVVGSGLQNPSAVEFGAGPGWPADHLFVSGFDGTIRELTPPAAAVAPSPGATSPPPVSVGAPTSTLPNTGAGAGTMVGAGGVTLLLVAVVRAVGHRRRSSAP